MSARCDRRPLSEHLSHVGKLRTRTRLRRSRRSLKKAGKAGEREDVVRPGAQPAQAWEAAIGRPEPATCSRERSVVEGNSTGRGCARYVRPFPRRPPVGIRSHDGRAGGDRRRARRPRTIGYCARAAGGRRRRYLRSRRRIRRRRGAARGRRRRRRTRCASSRRWRGRGRRRRRGDGRRGWGRRRRRGHGHRRPGHRRRRSRNNDGDGRRRGLLAAGAPRERQRGARAGRREQDADGDTGRPANPLPP